MSKFNAQRVWNTCSDFDKCFNQHFAYVDFEDSEREELRTAAENRFLNLYEHADFSHDTLSDRKEYVDSTCDEVIEEYLAALEFDEESLNFLVAQWPEVRDSIVAHYGENDKSALDQGFNDWSDSLHRDDMISDKVLNETSRDDIEKLIPDLW